MIARVFPSKNNATPNDPLAFVGEPPRRIEGLTRIMVSVTFSWDIPEARRIARIWEAVQGIPAEIGGPAMGDSGGSFAPGMFLKPGYVITSRGCPNSCWFCDVSKREGGIREIPITEGFNVLDSNLLACSEAHREAVFDMLRRQKRKPLFTGGLESVRVTPAIAKKLREIKTERLYCAYDTPGDLEPLQQAGAYLQEAGFSRSHHLYCYVLTGFPGDTDEKAISRYREAWVAGFFPMAMGWKDPAQFDWGKFVRKWARPAYARRNLKQMEAKV